MMTEKLYDQDSHMRQFTAQVVSCQWNEKKERYEVILDRTAFFPEEGGQYADGGTLNQIPVEDVRERDGVVVHVMREPLSVGETVEGNLDFADRFSKMPQPAGAHIVSGLVHRHFGYDNVGFHLGRELVTMDFNGPLTKDQISLIEQEANEAVTANLEITAEYPSAEELKQLEYRSKKELSGAVRIVTVPGYDVCACCAPHVSRTGEIGMIRLVDAMSYKGGTRVTMVCGFRALRDYRIKEDNVYAISRMLSAKPEQAAEAVERLRDEAAQWRGKLLQMQTRYLDGKLSQIPEGAENWILFEEELDKNVARRFVDAAMAKCGGICGIFLEHSQGGYQFILGSQKTDLGEFLKGFYQVFDGKGGGRGQMVQGTVSGVREQSGEKGLREEIEGYFEPFTEKSG